MVNRLRVAKRWGLVDVMYEADMNVNWIEGVLSACQQAGPANAVKGAAKWLVRARW